MNSILKVSNHSFPFCIFRRAIVEHKDSPLHKAVLTTLKKRKRVKLEDLSKYSEGKVTEGNEVTNTVMRTLYIGIKDLKASYKNLPYLVK